MRRLLKAPRLPVAALPVVSDKLARNGGPCLCFAISMLLADKSRSRYRQVFVDRLMSRPIHYSMTFERRSRATMATDGHIPIVAEGRTKAPAGTLINAAKEYVRDSVENTMEGRPRLPGRKMRRQSLPARGRLRRCPGSPDNVFVLPASCIAGSRPASLAGQRARTGTLAAPQAGHPPERRCPVPCCVTATKPRPVSPPPRQPSADR